MDTAFAYCFSAHDTLVGFKDAGTSYDRPDCHLTKKLSSAPASSAELPPPHRFRRQSSHKMEENLLESNRVREQDLNYLASHRAATARMLTAEMEGAQPLSQEELLATARQIFLS